VLWVDSFFLPTLHLCNRLQSYQFHTRASISFDRIMIVVYDIDMYTLISYSQVYMSYYTFYFIFNQLHLLHNSLVKVLHHQNGTLICVVF